jgi:plasmid maintenance system antidote protein VapI
MRFREISLPPVHPGRPLASELEARGLTAAALAPKLRVHPNRIAHDLALAEQELGPRIAKEVEAA